MEEVSANSISILCFKEAYCWEIAFPVKALESAGGGASLRFACPARTIWERDVIHGQGADLMIEGHQNHQVTGD
jgi:hypothetical protein